MPRFLRRFIVLVIALVALAPALALGQTPEPATPVPASEPAFTLTPIGAATTQVEGSGDSELQVWTLDAGPGGPIGRVALPMVVIHVQEGQLLVTPVDGTAMISVGTGAPIASPDGEDLCSEGECELPSGQQAALGPGNGFSSSDGTFEMHVTADEGAVAQVSTVSPNVAELCWICPISD